MLFHWTSLRRQLISIDLFLAWKKSIIIKPIVARTDTTPSKQPRIIDIVFWLQEATPRSEKQSKELMLALIEESIIRMYFLFHHYEHSLSA